jgi:ClpP class serine protease
MSAQDGKELGLIDEMAGLGQALERARAAAGLGPDSPVELWPASKGVIETINELLSGNGGDDALRSQRAWLRAHPLAASAPLEQWAAALRMLAKERIALIPPYLFSLR